jgi:hypothetical protein
MILLRVQLNRPTPFHHLIRQPVFHLNTISEYLSLFNSFDWEAAHVESHAGLVMPVWMCFIILRYIRKPRFRVRPLRTNRKTISFFILKK